MILEVQIQIFEPIFPPKIKYLGPLEFFENANFAARAPVRAPKIWI